MKGQPRKNTLMQLQVGIVWKIVVSFVIMLLLILIVYYCNIPNPNMILIAGLVLCSAMFGYGGGIVASVIMLFYTLFFFSTDNSFIHFTNQNFQKVIVSLFGITADMILVCALKRAEVNAFREIDILTEKLREENKHLHNLSLTDALTGIRNRLALRHDYDLYCNHEVTVMMVDLDKFKAINDNYGHQEGDRILKETAALLSDTFGLQHCYRFGGDEFLVIIPDIDEELFKERLDKMMKSKPEIKENGKTVQVGFSIGYVHEKLSDNDKLRKMFSSADELMYEAKMKTKAE